MSNIIDFPYVPPMDPARREGHIHAVLRLDDRTQEWRVVINHACRGWKFVIGEPQPDCEHELLIVPTIGGELPQKTKSQSLLPKHVIQTSEYHTLIFPNVSIILTGATSDAVTFYKYTLDDGWLFSGIEIGAVPWKLPNHFSANQKHSANITAM